MPRASAGDSARRLIALLGQLTPGMSVPVEELADSLGTSAAQLADDLGTLAMCGIAPYTPDQMVDVFVEDGMVEVYSPLPAVSAPVRLSLDESRALAAALAAAGFTAEDPLTGRLLEAASASFDADSLERTIRSTIATHDGEVFETLACAVRDREAIEIAYQSEGAAEPTERVVEPQQLFAERGAWYLSAWCRTAGGIRTFRVDRVRGALKTGERFESVVAPASADAPTAFAPEGLPLAQLRFAPGEAFVEREWPGGRVVSAQSDGSTLAEVPYGGTGWIARHVVARLGGVEALAPAEVRAAVLALARQELSKPVSARSRPSAARSMQADLANHITGQPSGGRSRHPCAPWVQTLGGVRRLGGPTMKRSSLFAIVLVAAGLLLLLAGCACAQQDLKTVAGTMTAPADPGDSAGKAVKAASAQMQSVAPDAVAIMVGSGGVSLSPPPEQWQVTFISKEKNWIYLVDVSHGEATAPRQFTKADKIKASDVANTIAYSSLKVGSGAAFDKAKATLSKTGTVPPQAMMNVTLIKLAAVPEGEPGVWTVSFLNGTSRDGMRAATVDGMTGEASETTKE